MVESVLFWIAAAALLLCAVRVVTCSNPLRAALWLIAALCSQAVLYVLLHASFVAAMQILVYAGAIMVLFVFVIMLLNLEPGLMRPTYLSMGKIIGGASVAYFVGQLIKGVSAGGVQPVDGSVKHVGTLLMTDYLFAFEAISVLLLVAVVGAVVLGLKRLT